MRSVFFSLALVGLSVPHSAAAVPPALDVVVDVDNVGGEKCGVTRRSVDAAIRAALRYNRISFSDVADPFVYVNVNVAQNSAGYCVATWRVEISRFSVAQFDGYQSTLSVRMVMCDDGGFLARFQRINNMSDVIKNGFDTCLAKVKEI